MEAHTERIRRIGRWLALRERMVKMERIYNLRSLTRYLEDELDLKFTQEQLDEKIQKFLEEQWELREIRRNGVG